MQYQKKEILNCQIQFVFSWSNSNITLRKENVYSDFQDAPRSDNH